MPYRIRCGMRFDKPLDITVRPWRQLLRDSMQDVAQHWHRVMAPRHFRQDARARYGYRPRSAKYLKRPRKRGRPDLVYTWATFNAVVRGTPQIRAFPTRARLEYSTPDYVQMRSRRADRPILGQEIAKTTAEEVLDLGRMTQATVEARIQAMREQRTVTIQ